MRYLPIMIGMVVLVAVAGCLSSAHYMVPPEGSIENGSGSVPVNPNRFSVSSEAYSSYRIQAKFVPPKPEICTFGGCYKSAIIAIKPTDIWKVTHKIGERLLIQSDEYMERVCRRTERTHNIYNNRSYLQKGAKCVIDRKYAVYITQDGLIDGGWEVFFPNKVSFENRMYFSPTSRETKEWGAATFVVAP